MPRSRFITVFLILVFGVCVMLILWRTGRDHELQPQVKKQKTFVYPLKIKGLSYSTHDKGRLIARIEADELKVKKRKFWVFNVRPFNEAVLTNARLEFYLYDDMPSNDDMSSKVDLLSTARSILTLDEQGRTGTQGLGLITRGLIDGLEIRIYKADEPFLLLKADKARIDFKRKKINMKGVSVEDFFTGKLIKTRTAVWDNEAKILRIPGTYTAEKPEGTTVGKTMEMDFGFSGIK